MRYLFDTDTLIDVFEDRDQVRTQISTMIEAGDEVALCPRTVAELYSGLSEKKRVKWENWLAALPYWSISCEAAMQAGIDRKAASDKGRTLCVPDALIAAVARECRFARISLDTAASLPQSMMSASTISHQNTTSSDGPHLHRLLIQFGGANTVSLRLLARSCVRSHALAVLQHAFECSASSNG